MPTSITVQQYLPSEIIAMFNENLSQQNIKAVGKIVSICGIYQAGVGNSYNGVYYDSIRDENSPAEHQIKITDSQRANLVRGNKVEVVGTLGRKITPKGDIKLELSVSRVEVIQQQVVDEDETKRIEFRQRKVVRGFKNVDSILEGLLINNERPKIALLIAQNSITLADFENGARAARAAVDFVEERISFTQTRDFCAKLRALDQRGFHAIAIVRGGGIDSKTDVDKPDVIETVVGLKTPVIAGVGHQNEQIFLRQVADKVASTPQGLGQYFSDMVESVTAKKTNSKASLLKEVEAQYKGQIEAHQKVVKTLEEQKNTLDKQLQQEKKEVEALRQKLAKRGGSTFGLVIRVIIALAAVAYIVLKVMHVI